MYKLEEISELPSGTFSMTNIKMYLFVISAGKTEELAIKRYELLGIKKEDKYLKIKDETFILNSELEDMGDWNISKIFSSQDNEWMQYQESTVKKVSLGEVANIFRGKLVNTKDENGKIGVVNISNIRDYDINYETLDHLDEDERKISGYLLKEGDLLLPARGTAMRTAVFEEKNYPCIASSNIIIIRPKDKLLSATYLKVFLDSDIGGKILQSLQQGTVVMNISHKDLTTIQIPLLPLEEQKEIENEYKKELKIYQKSIEDAEEKWSKVIKKLKNKF
jgi:restriction endonuclease S subunit